MSKSQLELIAMYRLTISGRDLSILLRYLFKPSDIKAMELRDRLIALRQGQADANARACAQITKGKDTDEV